MSLGPAGLREVARTAVLNNNYIAKRVAQIRGAAISYLEANPEPRLEQIRYSWERLAEETGVSTEDIRARIIDFGVQTYWPSHHPYTVREPFSIEPTESVSKDDLDEFAEVLRHVAEEAYSDPQLVKSAPHRSTTAKPRSDAFADPPITWRGYLRRKL
ncbi:MAG: hypothetical protein HY646_05525 [Acidobacteria bacterium]|nr:hypothetical protein [Acidobacteriota bacterium]